MSNSVRASNGRSHNVPNGTLATGYVAANWFSWALKGRSSCDRHPKMVCCSQGTGQSLETQRCCSLNIVCSLGTRRLLVTPWCTQGVSDTPERASTFGLCCFYGGRTCMVERAQIPPAWGNNVPCHTQHVRATGFHL